MTKEVCKKIFSSQCFLNGLRIFPKIPKFPKIQRFLSTVEKFDTMDTKFKNSNKEMV